MASVTHRVSSGLTALFVLTGLSAGCAGTTGSAPDETMPVAAPDETAVAAAPAELPRPGDPDFAAVPPELRAAAAHEGVAEGVAGRELFESVCAQCHSVTPPAKTAPPIAMVARHYRQAFATPGDARAAMVRWVGEPAAERSAMPPRAVERFGLMPGLSLSAAQAEGVVDYVLSLDAGTGGPGGEGRGMGGQGMHARGHGGERGAGMRGMQGMQGEGRRGEAGMRCMGGEGMRHRHGAEGGEGGEGGG